VKYVSIQMKLLICTHVRIVAIVVTTISHSARNANVARNSRLQTLLKGRFLMSKANTLPPTEIYDVLHKAEAVNIIIPMSVDKWWRIETAINQGAQPATVAAGEPSAVQQLKAEIAAIADRLQGFNDCPDGGFNDIQDYINRLQQLSAV
jgi:hypothetical protein